MLSYSRYRRAALAATFFMASCSQGDAPSVSGPNPAAATAGSGTAGLLAEGDVKVGPGPIAIEEVRMDRQTSAGASIYRQYASPFREYRMEAGETIELWVEWVRGGNNAPVNPRLFVDWGESGSDGTDFINCGVCLLKHTYRVPGRYTVKVTLDDRNGTTVTRTFYLNSLPATAACTAPSSTPIPFLSANIVEMSPFFTGSDLVYSASMGSCSTSREVAALGASSFSINPTTGTMDFSSADCGCYFVTATNTCGATTQGFDWCDD